MGSQSVVRAWLAFKLTGSEFALGMVMFAVAVPMLFIAPIGGVIADRVDRRNLIAAGQFVIILNEIFILSLILLDRLAFWHLLTAAMVMGCVFPFIMPARHALVISIVGKAAIGKAMALSMAGISTTRVLGPAAAGFLIDLVGIGHTYIFGTLLYGIGLLCLLRVKKMHLPEGAQKTSIKSSMIEGFTYVGENRLLLILLLFGLVPMFLAMPFQNLLVVFADKIWDVGSRGLGLLSAFSGVGGVVGSLWVSTIGSAQNRLQRMLISMLIFGISLFCFSISPYFLIGLALVFVANVFASIYSTLNNTAIQLLIPDQVRGRISSFLMMSFSLPLLGTLPVAALAEAYGAPFAVGLASILATLIAALFYIFSSSLRNMDASLKEAVGVR